LDLANFVPDSVNNDDEDDIIFEENDLLDELSEDVWIKHYKKYN
jgi:hypothetical protein